MELALQIAWAIVLAEVEVLDQELVVLKFHKQLVVQLVDHL